MFFYLSSNLEPHHLTWCTTQPPSLPTQADCLCTYAAFLSACTAYINLILTFPVEKRKPYKCLYTILCNEQQEVFNTLTAAKWWLRFLILKQWCIKLWPKFHSSLLHSKFYSYPSNITTIKSHQIYLFVKHGGNLQCVLCKFTVRGV